jgi:hypothetical protein
MSIKPSKQVAFWYRLAGYYIYLSNGPITDKINAEFTTESMPDYDPPSGYTVVAQGNFKTYAQSYIAGLMLDHTIYGRCYVHVVWNYGDTPPPTDYFKKNIAVCNPL